MKNNQKFQITEKGLELQDLYNIHEFPGIEFEDFDPTVCDILDYLSDGEPKSYLKIGMNLKIIDDFLEPVIKGMLRSHLIKEVD